MKKRPWLAWLLLLPPALFALNVDHGRPFMLSNLFGPNSNHSTVGLLLLFVALLVCPLGALAGGLLSWRSSRSRASVALAVAALLLLLAGLTIRQPYTDEWQPGPGSRDEQVSTVHERSCALPYCERSDGHG